MTQQVDPVHLRDFMNSHFTSADIRVLCHDMKIDYEDLEGANKAIRTISLITYTQHRGFYDDLVKRVQALRPDIPIDPSAPPAKPAADTPARAEASSVTNIYNIKGDLVGRDKVGKDKVEGDKIEIDEISDSTGIAIGREASAEVSIINQGPPQDKANFVRQIEELKAYLEKAIAAGDFNNADDGQDAADDLKKALREVNAETPRANRINDRLETVTKLIESGAKAGSAALKATPIIAGLIKAVSSIF